MLLKTLKDPQKPWYPFPEHEWIERRIPKSYEIIAGEEPLSDLTVKNYRIEINDGHMNLSQLSENIYRIKVKLDAKDEHPEWNFSLVENLEAKLKEIGELPLSHQVNIADWISIPEKDNDREDDGGTIFEVKPYDGLSLGFYANKELNAIKCEFSAEKIGNIYGLGEKYWGLDKRGRKYTFYNTDYSAPKERKEPMYQSHPVLILRMKREQNDNDSQGPNAPDYILIFSHRPEMTFIDLREDLQSDEGSGNARHKARRYSLEIEAPILDLYIIGGRDLYGIINRYTALTGRMPMPPIWALGMHQCRWGYKSSADIREITGKYRELGIPCDTIWYDIDYMDKWAIFTWHPVNFKDYKELNAQLHEKGWHIVTIIDPGMALKSHYKPVLEGIENDYFAFKENLKDGVHGIYESPVWPPSALFPDFFRSDVKEWWAKLHKEFLLDSKVDGIWNDMNELVAFKEPDRKTWPHMLHLTDEGEYIPHKILHNLYALEEAKATWQGLLEAYPERRPFILTRAGFPGIQRYSAVWTGDNFSEFEEIWQSIPMLANLGLCGQAFVGADIGGFSGLCYPVLLMRWIQLGVFYPFARNHSAFQAQEPWVGEYLVPGSTEVNKMYYKFRYYILPYQYSQFFHAHQTGFPIWRPLVAQFPNDPEVFDNDDEVMIGPSILLAPVFNDAEPDEDEGNYPLDFVPDERPVYLPKDDRNGAWYDVYTGKFIKAGTKITVTAPIDTLPMFIRDLSAIPVAIPGNNVKETLDNTKLLHIFVNPTPPDETPNASTDSFKSYERNILYTDKGDGWEYKNDKEYNLYEIKIAATYEGGGLKSLEINIDAIEENFKDGRLEDLLIVIHGPERPPKRVLVDGDDAEIKEHYVKGLRFSPKSMKKIDKDVIEPIHGIRGGIWSSSGGNGSEGESYFIIHHKRDGRMPAFKLEYE